jgi:hypothetical protein
MMADKYYDDSEGLGLGWILFIVGLVILGGLWWYTSWQADKLSNTPKAKQERAIEEKGTTLREYVYQPPSEQQKKIWADKKKGRAKREAIRKKRQDREIMKLYDMMVEEGYD